MDSSKVNPVLGYQMYSNLDLIKERKRSAYGIDIPLRPSTKKKD